MPFFFMNKAYFTHALCYDTMQHPGLFLESKNDKQKLLILIMFHFQCRHVY